MAERLAQNLPFVQLLVGPGEIGKTTAARRIVEQWNGPRVFVSADDPTPKSASWLSMQ